MTLILTLTTPVSKKEKLSLETMKQLLQRIDGRSLMMETGFMMKMELEDLHPMLMTSITVVKLQLRLLWMMELKT